VNLIGIKLTNINDVVSFSDDNLASSGDIWIEVSRSSVENEIAVFIGLPALDEGKITLK